ncbi:MAG: hypothetical protein JO154_12310 [Chitinophaga sp.]|uniref:hypothetical protein n=1 Tax=Chitinophaga sp. TaxID=1869181 RepID=UPI0025BA7BC5|nr:hypothetical protein [Chitinophaga sp.]MBV8253383.1 hypothetical protein [Chitinophaga sp.]
MVRGRINKAVAGSLFIILLAVCQDTFAQHGAVNLQRSITMPVGDIRFDSLVHLITRQTGVRFSLNTHKFPPSRIVHIQKGSQSLGDLLGTIREKTGIYYTVLGAHIIFVDNPPRKVAVANGVPPSPTSAFSTKATISIIKTKDNKNKQLPKAPPLKVNDVIERKLLADTVVPNTILKDNDTTPQVLMKKIDTAHHKVDSVRTKGTRPTLSLGKRNTDTTYHINYSPISLRDIRLPGFNIGGRNTDPGYYLVTSTGTRPGFSLQWPDFSGLSFNFRGNHRDTTIYKKETDEAITPLSTPSTTATIVASTSTATAAKSSNKAPVTTPTTTRLPTSFLRSAWKGLTNVHLPNIQLPSLQRNGGVQTEGTRPLFSPVIKAGFSADETFYFNTTIQGGFRFLYGIASWNTNFKTAGFRYGAGIAVGLSEDWRLHLTGTTGRMEKGYDTAGLHKQAESRHSRIGLTAEKQLNEKWSLQLGITYSLLRTTYYINGERRAPIMDEDPLRKYLNPITPLYTISNNYDLGGAEHNQSWIGFQLGIFYNINFSKRR